MKHAYLILAHNEWEILQRLVTSLDSCNTDIFIHFDAKIKELPKFSVKNSNLYICENRIDVRWGDVSQIKAMYALWEYAYSKNKYRRFNMIQGQSCTLKTVENITNVLDSAYDISIFQMMETCEAEINTKIRRYNIFSKNMMSYQFGTIGYRFWRLLWNIIHKIQKLTGYARYKEARFYKSSALNFLTRDAVRFLISNKDEILKKYKWTFCGDEFFILSELKNSPLRTKIVDNQNILKQDFVSIHPKIYMESDYNYLMESGCWFARKLSKSSVSLIDKIENSRLV